MNGLAFTTRKPVLRHKIDLEEFPAPILPQFSKITLQAPLSELKLQTSVSGVSVQPSVESGSDLLSLEEMERKHIAEILERTKELLVVKVVLRKCLGCRSRLSETA